MNFVSRSNKRKLRNLFFKCYQIIAKVRVADAKLIKSEKNYCISRDF
jgi:hypothetical protein